MVDDPHWDVRVQCGGAKLNESQSNTIGAKTDDARSSRTTMSDFEMMSKRVRHHRSISQLIENIGKVFVDLDRCAANGSYGSIQ